MSSTFCIRLFVISCLLYWWWITCRLIPVFYFSVMLELLQYCGIFTYLLQMFTFPYQVPPYRFLHKYCLIFFAWKTAVCIYWVLNINVLVYSFDNSVRRPVMLQFEESPVSSKLLSIAILMSISLILFIKIIHLWMLTTVQLMNYEDFL